MGMGKRSYGGDDDKEHDAKRSSSIGGGGDDEEHDTKRSSAIGEHDAQRSSAIGGGYDDDDDLIAYRCRIRYRYPSPEPDYPHVKALEQLPVYDVKTLDLHIKYFEQEPAIFDGLQKRVASGIDDQKTCELRKVWKGTESPDEAGRLVLDVLYDIYCGRCNLCDIEGFLEHYGLPSVWELEPLTGVFGLPPLC